MSVRNVLFICQPQSVTAIFQPLKEAGLEVGIADSLGGALAFIKKSPPACVFSKTRLPGYRVEQLLSKAAEAMGSFPPVVAFTEAGTADEARRLMELGARDYWLEPVVFEKVAALLPRVCAEPGEAVARPSHHVAHPSSPSHQAHLPHQAVAAKPAGGVDIIGRHPAIQRVLALCRQVARSKASVLISGESGTGKEKFARFLHGNSDRADKPFVAINCAALPEHLLESELFGHEKGAFTGAITRKLGRFELAHGGTILLDEISEMDLGLQAKLLRVLQEQEIDRVGGTETVKVDVRVLATTNRNIEDHVRDGKFRQDLFYRLNVIPLKLPPLRERGEDVLLLADWFKENFRRQYGLSELAFSAEARAWLLEYEWPGNVRELQNLMERAVLLAGDGPIRTLHFLLDADAWTPEPEALESEVCAPAVEPALHVQAPVEEDEEGESLGFEPRMQLAESYGPRTMRRHLSHAPHAAYEGGNGDHAQVSAPVQAASAPQGPDELVPLAEMEKRMILLSLDQTQGNRTQAASLLGISVRTLRNKLNEYRQQGLDIP